MKLCDNWECRYNVFSDTYNTCSAPQEPMPEDGEEERPTPLPLVDELFAGRAVVVEPSKETLFTKSDCTCALCREINDAVGAWNGGGDHPVPLIRCLLNSISATEHIAKNMEDEKVFLYK